MANEVLELEEVDAEQAANEPSLATLLRSAREKRELSLSGVAARIHVPAKYLSMLEASNYSAICDELYLLPYLRSYCGFLGLPADEMIVRFVQEVQRAEATAAVKLPDLREDRAAALSSWFTTMAVVLFVVLGFFLASLR